MLFHGGLQQIPRTAASNFEGFTFSILVLNSVLDRPFQSLTGCFRLIFKLIMGFMFSGLGKI